MNNGIDESYLIVLEAVHMDSQTATIYLDGICKDNGKKVRFPWPPQMFKYAAGASIFEEMSKLADILRTHYIGKTITMKTGVQEWMK